MKPGWYEFGRDDGTVEPRVVHVVPAKDHGFTFSGERGLVQAAIHALVNEGWWWNSIRIPSRLPMGITPSGGVVWMRSLPPPPAKKKGPRP